MGITLAVLFAVPVLGIARVDLVGGANLVLGKAAPLRAGVIAVAGAIASFYFVTFLINLPAGRMFCGFGCPIGQLSRFSDVIDAFPRDPVRRRRAWLELVAFAEEEGQRYKATFLGSGALTGDFDAAWLDQQDADGVTMRQAMERAGLCIADIPKLKRDPAKYLGFVEVHIEQGPVLEAEGLQVGVVTGVQGISWQEVTIHGRAAHAGTTPTELRVDAGLAASHVVVRVREMAESGDFGALRATVGEMRFAPGLTNIVPTRAVFTVDLRNPDDDAMARAEDALETYLHELEERWPGLSVSVRRMARTRHVPFDPEVQKAVATAADDLDLSHRALLSGAGHDAQELASICPTAMVFVPGRYDGISHNPREYSTPEACADGINVLLHAVLGLLED